MSQGKVTLASFQVNQTQIRSVMRGKWWDFSGNWLDWLEGSQRRMRWERWNICGGGLFVETNKGRPFISERKQRAWQGQKELDGTSQLDVEGGWGRERTKAELWAAQSLPNGRKLHCLVWFLLKTSVWVLSVHPTTASLLVSHQGSQLSCTDTDSFPPTHVLQSLELNTGALRPANLRLTSLYTVALSPPLCPPPHFAASALLSTNPTDRF